MSDTPTPADPTPDPARTPPAAPDSGPAASAESNAVAPVDLPAVTQSDLDGVVRQVEQDRVQDLVVGAGDPAALVPAAVPAAGDPAGTEGGSDAVPSGEAASAAVPDGSKAPAPGDTAAWGRPMHDARPGVVPTADPGAYHHASAAAPGWRMPISAEAGGASNGALWSMLESGAQPYPRRVPPMRRPPRSEVIPMPRGTFTAIAGAGVAAAVCVPLDRPGIGWLLAVLASGGAVYAIDRRARRDARQLTPEAGPASDAAVPESRIAADPSMDSANPAVSQDNSGDNANVGEERESSAAAHGVTNERATGESSAATHAVTNERVAGQSSVASQTGSRGHAGPWSRLPVIGGWSADRVLRSTRVWWLLLAVALVSVGTFRAANWLFVLCLVGAAMVSSLAVVGRRSAYGSLFDLLAVPYGALTALPWLYRWAGRRETSQRPGSRRAGWSVLATLGLLVVFVPLLAGADAVFARLVSGLIPSLDPADVWSWGFLFVTAGLGVAGALYVLAGPPPVAQGDSRAGEVFDDLLAGSSIDGAQGVRRFSKAEWGLPLGALTVLFVVFLGTQLAVLFGGDGYVQRTADLTYAEYARNGFWQLSIVSLLTLAVIVIVQRCALTRTPGDRLWLRVAVAAVSVLTMVIVASALHRMWTYQQAYGFTVLRVLVSVFELWIALIYVLVLASLVRLSREWVPRAAIGAAALTLLGLAVLNPEGFIADRNIDRWEASHRLDSGYLSGLSADALPAVDRLPAAQRDRIADAIRAEIERDSWRGWNLSRARAR
ncbi:DUF4153 domain-containing protein [Nocardia sp. NPDC058058]|uniref:DUF4153 domain-containing protein n=1 Tax=Nocardia sp. NPDC058058 TaxID=3346317 RepID=UPI0036DD2E8F